jgi:hypothetical protein
MVFAPTNRSAIVSGLAAGAAIPLIESSLPSAIAFLVAALLFLGSALFFAIGHENVHIKAVWSWADLTPGEQRAFSVRVPLWFVSLSAALLAVGALLQ